MASAAWSDGTRRPVPWDGAWVLRLALVAAVGAAARIAVLALTRGYVPRHDDRQYVDYALALERTGHFPVFALVHGPEGAGYRPPGWPAALWLWWQVSGVSLESSRALLVILGAAAALLVTLLGERLAGRRAGLAAGLLAALCPPLLVLSTTLESETLFCLLVCAAALAAVHAHERADRAALRPAVLTGALAGAAALTRSNGLVLLPAFALLALPARERLAGLRLAAPTRHQALVVAAVLGAGAAVIAPWTLRNARVLHAFVPISTETGNTLAGTYNAVSDRADGQWLLPSRIGAYTRIYREPISQAQRDRALTHAVGRWVSHHPGYPLKVIAANTARLTGLTGPGWSRFSLGTMSLRSRTLAMLNWSAWSRRARWPSRVPFARVFAAPGGCSPACSSSVPHSSTESCGSSRRCCRSRACSAGSR